MMNIFRSRQLTDNSQIFLLLFPTSAIQCILVPGILNECWQPARRRTTGVIVTTGEELMTPVSLRGCRSAVKVILIVPLEAPFLKLCQQQPSSLKQIKKKLEDSIIFYFKKMNGFFFSSKGLLYSSQSIIIE